MGFGLFECRSKRIALFTHQFWFRGIVVVFVDCRFTRVVVIVVVVVVVFVFAFV
jgi:hypothetical protein